MKKIEIKTSFTTFQSVEELPQDVKSLMEKAIEIRKNAYAPYSKFRVGAALLLDNGKIVLGSNQENAAYPSGLCAERVGRHRIRRSRDPRRNLGSRGGFWDCRSSKNSVRPFYASYRRNP
jgi:hypothetical protein